MKLKTARGTSALLALEDAAPDVLFEKLPGASVPLWPDVRSDFMYVLQEHDFGAVSVGTAPSSRSQAWLRLMRALLPSRWDAWQLHSLRSALFLVGGGTTHVVDGKIRNWLVGDYVEQFPALSAILQWRSIDSRKPAFPLTRSLDPMITRAAGYARLSRRKVDPGRVLKLVGELARRLDERITGEQIEAIASSATYAASSSPHVEAQFSRVLDRVDPRVVLMEDASYGGRAALVALMKERGILVAEPQHGWIGPTHGAYNFGAAMREPELRATLPDELLTFGEYWSDGIRHPASSVAIGKPHLESMALHARDRVDRPREVLLVSSVTDPEATTEFTLALRGGFPDNWVIRFRPHPSERATLRSRYPRLLTEPGITLDENSDVYESLGTARGVIGVASTVLFEALAMGCRVFVRESPFTDYYVGDLFGNTFDGTRDVERIVRTMVEDLDHQDESAYDSIWKPGAVENFRAWLQTRLNMSA